jgi:hypothetical protein
MAGAAIEGVLLGAAELQAGDDVRDLDPAGVLSFGF